ncbi:hypothetical protein DFH11DRAFT_1609122 [Phellopilus nigrolimitatus]|nr:hypothetical protein DFH11DRAFT_1609122 [Phellopilus nigrolimitatus]
MLPLVPLGVPSAADFAPLVSFLYTRSAGALFRRLVPPACVPAGCVLGQGASVALLAAALAASLAPASLMAGALRVHGVWRNACSLGVFDRGLWAAIDVAWGGYAGALGMARRI